MINVGPKAKGNKSFTLDKCLVAQCIDASGDIIAGYLLSRVIYWNKRARFERNGHHWIVFRRDQWLTHTSLTRHQYDRALSILKRRKLVKVMHDKLRKRDRHLQTFIRLPDGFSLSAVADDDDSGHVSATADSDTPSPSGVADSDPGSPSATADNTEDNTDNLDNDDNGNNYEAAPSATAAFPETLSEAEEISGKEIISINSEGFSRIGSQEPCAVVIAIRFTF